MILQTVRISMKNVAKSVLVVLGIINALHFILILCMPFTGLHILVTGIFHGVIYNSRELSELATETKFFLNIISSLLYIGSLIVALIITLAKGKNIRRRLIWAIVFTLIPFTLIFLKLLFVAI